MSDGEEQNDDVEASSSSSYGSTKNIIKKLEKYNIPEDIKYQANSVFLRMRTKTHRKKKDVQRSFFCTYSAYKELNQVINFTDLCDIFGLTKGEGQASLTMFSFIQTGYKPVVKKYTAIDFIPSIALELNLNQDTINDILLLAENILQKYKELNDKNVIFLAKAIIKYYIFVHGIELKEEFKTSNTINNIYKIILELENTP